MKFAHSLSLLLISLVLFTGCEKEVASGSGNPSPTLPVQPQRPPAPAGQAQPKLPTVKLWLGTNELVTEVASKLQEIQTGMMWRTNMAEMEGMLFVFPVPQRVSFWMKNTLVPLSCAYIDAEGTILEIYPMTPQSEDPIPSTSHQVQYVLEVNQNWFQRHNVSTGMLVKTEFGTLQETFFRRRP